VKIDNISIGSYSNYTFNNATADHTISAAFTPIIYTITETAGDGGLINPEGIVALNHGNSQTYNIVPNDEFQVKDVKIDDIYLGAISSYEFDAVTANHIISATFIPILFTLLTKI
jgi:hypothetical protein